MYLICISNPNDYRRLRSCRGQRASIKPSSRRVKRFSSNTSADKLCCDWEQTWQLISRARPTFALCVSQTSELSQHDRRSNTHRSSFPDGKTDRAVSVERLQTGEMMPEHTSETDRTVQKTHSVTQNNNTHAFSDRREFRGQTIPLKRILHHKKTHLEPAELVCWS